MAEDLYQPGYVTLTYCAATRSGEVVFLPAGRDLLRRGRLTTREARDLARELGDARTVADHLVAKDRGDYLWGSVGRDGDIMLVKHLGHTARMRPITNGRRRGPIPWWECTACGKGVPVGCRMYVCEGEVPFGWGSPRLCEDHTAPLDPVERIAEMVDLGGSPTS